MTKTTKVWVVASITVREKIVAAEEGVEVILQEVVGTTDLHRFQLTMIEIKLWVVSILIRHPFTTTITTRIMINHESMIAAK